MRRSAASTTGPTPEPEDIGHPAARGLLEALSGPGAADAIRALDVRRTLTGLIPELEEGRGFAQPELHYYDVLEHNLAAVAALDEALEGAGAAELRTALSWLDIDAIFDGEVDGVELRTLTRLACLLHDVAKPRTATIVEGRLRFPRHGPTGAGIVLERLPAIGLGALATDFVARLVRQHLRPAELIRNAPPTERAIRRFVADVNGHVLPLMLVNLADGWATRGPRYTRENFRRHCGFVNWVAAHCAGTVD